MAPVRVRGWDGGACVVWLVHRRDDVEELAVRRGALAARANASDVASGGQLALSCVTPTSSAALSAVSYEDRLGGSRPESSQPAEIKVVPLEGASASLPVPPLSPAKEE
jgi:hypothetical protein